MTNDPANTGPVADPITEKVISTLVREFYGRIREDAMLGPIFNGAIDDWEHHLVKLEAFWSSIMLTSGRYKGQPMIAHLRHADDMKPEAFARWLELWRETSDDLLDPAIAARFQDKAGRIAESLTLGIDFHRNRRAIPGRAAPEA